MKLCNVNIKPGEQLVEIKINSNVVYNTFNMGMKSNTSAL